MTAELQTNIELTENNFSLYDEKNFNKRADAVDFLEFRILEHIDYLLLKAIEPNELDLLKKRAENVKAEFEGIDNTLFQKLRENIRSTGCRGAEFKKLVGKYLDFGGVDSECLDDPGYNNVDIFINRLFSNEPLPEQTKSLEPEMIYYQKTPARIVFELTQKVRFTNGDVFFDLGSGLGQVAILVNRLTGVKTVGVEFEPAFCAYANDSVEALNLAGVTFINADARVADYSEGTVFFMYTPFTGEMLQEVLERLKKEAMLRKIRIITYGPCTAYVASQSWLNFAGSKNDSIYKLAVFNSL